MSRPVPRSHNLWTVNMAGWTMTVSASDAGRAIFDAARSMRFGRQRDIEAKREPRPNVDKLTRLHVEAHHASTEDCLRWVGEDRVVFEHSKLAKQLGPALREVNIIRRSE